MYDVKKNKEQELLMFVPKHAVTEAFSQLLLKKFSLIQMINCISCTSTVSNGLRTWLLLCRVVIPW